MPCHILRGRLPDLTPGLWHYPKWQLSVWLPLMVCVSEPGCVRTVEVYNIMSFSEATVVQYGLVGELELFHLA